MSFGQPAILRKSAKKRQEILDAVDEVLSIAAGKMAFHDENYYEVANLSGILQSRSIQLSSIDKGMKFICGRTQQRYLKRFLRQWKVSIEAQKIAQETGVSAEQIEKVFMVMLCEYIHP